MKGSFSLKKRTGLLVLACLPLTLIAMPPQKKIELSWEVPRSAWQADHALVTDPSLESSEQINSALQEIHAGFHFSSQTENNAPHDGIAQARWVDENNEAL